MLLRLEFINWKNYILITSHCPYRIIHRNYHSNMLTLVKEMVSLLLLNEISKIDGNENYILQKRSRFDKYIPKSLHYESDLNVYQFPV